MIFSLHSLITVQFITYKHELIIPGPKPTTVDDMWTLIWQSGTCQVVMVTQCVEQMKVTINGFIILTCDICFVKTDI